MEEGNGIKGIDLVNVNTKLSVIDNQARDALPPSFVQAMEKIAEGLNPLTNCGDANCVKSSNHLVY
jgi:hypothetical protein